ncbi:sulfotransferase 1 family member D1-like [Corticium candelabrum]|uniref:sulfotransferase 1 family member D1-like n=1 Tax=Corticium candelabrum TaxID=121492 RepID=UPI002E2590E2|nr:sulfotransferase 1 family member D1-like [Corticium candelabrum]
MTSDESSGIALLKRNRAKLCTTESRLKGLSFVPRPDDVFIATYPKAGTTWVQQIVQQLRTRGSMDFDDIFDVIPRIEKAADMGIDLDAEQVAKPRAYKIHTWYDHCPKGAKCIVVIRDPRSVASSLYNYVCGWLFQREQLDIETFIRDFFLTQSQPTSKLEKASYWHFYASWWPHRNDPNVLWLFFEDMLDNHLRAVKKIAEFINCGADDDQLHQLVVQQSSLQFMKEHISKFDNHTVRAKRNQTMNVSESASGAPLVNEGKADSYKTQLSSKAIQAIDDKWKVMEEATGCGSYSDLRKHFGTTESP